MCAIDDPHPVGNRWRRRWTMQLPAARWHRRWSARQENVFIADAVVGWLNLHVHIVFESVVVFERELGTRIPARRLQERCELAVRLCLPENGPGMLARTDIVRVRAGAGQVERSFARVDFDDVWCCPLHQCLQPDAGGGGDTYFAGREVVVATGADVGGEDFRDRCGKHWRERVLSGADRCRAGTPRNMVSRRRVR